MCCRAQGGGGRQKSTEPFECVRMLSIGFHCFCVNCCAAKILQSDVCVLREARIGYVKSRQARSSDRYLTNVSMMYPRVSHNVMAKTS